ncbi:MAG: hypothetical protein PHR06_04305 [Candidatus Cloacimonetes bacterium]|nr:hypothetical protein [Candidatus Cloacimonadota bacterium]
MFYIFLSVICSVAIGNLLNLFHKDKTADDKFIFIGNYFIASVFSFISARQIITSLNLFDFSIGVLGGFLFLSGLIIYKKNIEVNGLSLSVSAMRISLVIPTLMSLIMFNENLAFYNYFGVIVVIVSFLYLPGKYSFRNIVWLLLLFLVIGLADALLKIYEVYGKSNHNGFIFLIFSSAFVFNILWILFTGTKFKIRSLTYGFILGIPNQLTTKFFLIALITIPAAIAYPLSASSVVVLSILSDIFFWKKRFSKRQKIAFIALLIGIILLNIKQ